MRYEPRPRHSRLLTSAFGIVTERLEHRRMFSVTPAVRTVQELTVPGGPSAGADISDVVIAFRNDLGDPLNNATPGPLGTAGRREINWDGVQDFDSAPGRFPNNFFNAVSTRGATFVTANPLGTFMVSADSTNPDSAPVRFGNLNANYATAFGTFTAERLFTSIGTNVYDVLFTVPGTNTPANVSGFGAVFTDVDTAGSTKIDYFDSSGNLIYSKSALATAGDGSLSFVGVSFFGFPVHRVRITAGDGALLAASSPEDITQGGTADLVVADDFLYGEPQAIGTRELVVANGGKGAPQVRVLNADTGAEVANFLAYDAAFKGGVRVATGDVNGDGVPDIVTAPGKGQAALIRVFSGVDRSQIAEFTAFNFRGGANVAVGNVNGDQFADIIVARDKGNGPAERQVRVFSGATGNADLGSFNVGPLTFKGGFTVAAGDLNGDFKDDIIVGQGTGGSLVRAIDATKLTDIDTLGNINSTAVLREVNAFDSAFRGGVNVAAGDVNGDGIPDLVVGAGLGVGSASRVRTFNGPDFVQIRELFAFHSNSNGGVRVAVQDINGDGRADVVMGAGPGGGPNVRNAGVRVRDLDSLLAFDAGFKGGVYVGVLE